MPRNIALDRHETRAETVNAGIILVAGVLIDLSLATKRRFFGYDRQAIGLNRTITAAFTDEIIDNNKLFRILHRAAFAAAPFFGRTGLCVNEDRDTGDIS